jgi:CO/xanthine dehydrogenase Mo-binding subunit
MVTEVSATPPTVRVERIVAAVDCGVAVNPDVVTAQVEGAEILIGLVSIACGIEAEWNVRD